jgi:hypothetical protein
MACIYAKGAAENDNALIAVERSEIPPMRESLALATWSARAYEVPFQWHAFTPKARMRTTTL